MSQNATKPCGLLRHADTLTIIGAALTLIFGLGGPPAHAEDPIPELAQTGLDQIPAASNAWRRDINETADDTDVPALCESARQNIADGEFVVAITELDSALSQPGGACYEAFYLLAMAKRGLGFDGEARLAAECAVREQPSEVDAQVLLAQLHQERGRFTAAAARFRAATLAGEEDKGNPAVTVAWYGLGDCLEKTGYWRAAAQAFEHFDLNIWVDYPEHRRASEVAVILEEHPYGAIEHRLDLLRRLGDSNELARVADWAVESRPNEPFLARLQVRTLVDAGQADRAFECCLERLLEADSNGTPRKRGAALLDLALEAGRAANRLPVWTESLAADVTNGQHVELAVSVAHGLNTLGMTDLSIPLWRVLAAAHPDDLGAATSLAGALKSAGDLDGALHSLIEALRTAGSRADIPPAQLNAWMCDSTAVDEILQRAGELTARADCDYATFTVLGVTAAAGRQTDLATRFFQNAILDRPDFSLAHIAWGRMLLADHRWSEALEHANAALESNAESPPALLLKGLALVGLDQHDEARAALKAALAQQPDDVSYLIAIARFSRQDGDLLAAQRYFQQAWSLDRTLTNAFEELVDSYLEGGKLAIARVCLKDAEACDVPDDALRRVRTALRFAEAPMQSEHLAELSAQFEQHPDDIRTGLKLGAGLYINQRIDQAWAVLQQLSELDDSIINSDPLQARQLVNLLARVHLRRLENTEAIDILEQAVARHPRRRGTLHMLADAYIADFRIDDARDTLRRILELDLTPEQREAYRNSLLGMYTGFGQLDEAESLTDRWIAEEPDNEAWKRAKLSVLLAAERVDEALALANLGMEPLTKQYEELSAEFKKVTESLRDNPDNAENQARFEELQAELTTNITALFERRSDYVQVCLDGERYAEAEAHLRRWLEDLPEQPRIQQWLIEILLAADQGEKALETLGGFVAKTPADALQAFVWRARCFAKLGRLDDAISDLTSLLDEEFVNANPAARLEVRQAALELLAQAEDFERALAMCERWLADVDDRDRIGRLEVLTLQRYVLLMADREDESLVIGEELLAAQPGDPGLSNDLGYAWADRGVNIERALDLAIDAVAAQPSNPAFLDSLGWVYYKMGDFAAARMHIGRAVSMVDGHDPVVYGHLGDVEFRLGHTEAARNAWQAAVSLLEERDGARLSPRQKDELDALRGKLEALAGGEHPQVAPLAQVRQR